MPHKRPSPRLLIFSKNFHTLGTLLGRTPPPSPSLLILTKVLEVQFKCLSICSKCLVFSPFYPYSRVFNENFSNSPNNYDFCLQDHYHAVSAGLSSNDDGEAATLADQLMGELYSLDVVKWMIRGFSIIWSTDSFYAHKQNLLILL